MGDNFCNSLLIQHMCREANFDSISISFSPPSLKSLIKGVCLIFSFLPLQMKSLCICSILFIIVVGTSFKYEMNIILEKARDLKTVIFPDKERFLHLQIESTFSIFQLPQKKFTPRILKCSLFKFTFGPRF